MFHDFLTIPLYRHRVTGGLIGADILFFHNMSIGCNYIIGILTIIS